MDEAERLLDDYTKGVIIAARNLDANGLPDTTKILAALRKAGGVPEEFKAWLCREMPPGTVISNPEWWAPRIARALQAAAPQPPALDRDGVIEACAKVAEQYTTADHAAHDMKTGVFPKHSPFGHAVAAAIRAMKEQK